MNKKLYSVSQTGCVGFRKKLQLILILFAQFPEPDAASFVGPHSYMTFFNMRYRGF